jgi:tRNA threonylcarbamoyladenosine biosynthesis protein TsaB
LLPAVRRALDAAEASVRDLSALAVCLGPGTFTGVRIGLAAARGLRLPHETPLIGVSTLELIAAQTARAHPGRPVLAAIDARRDQVYAQLFRRGDAPWPEPWSAPAAMPAADAAAMCPEGAVLAGTGAAMVQRAAGRAAAQSGIDRPDAAVLLDLAGARAVPAGPPPRPIYLRAPDARPQTPPRR